MITCVTSSDDNLLRKKHEFFKIYSDEGHFVQDHKRVLKYYIIKYVSNRSSTLSLHKWRLFTYDPFQQSIKISILKNHQNLFYRNDNSQVTSGETCSYLSPCTISQNIGILPSCHSSNCRAKDVPVFHKTPHMTTYRRDGVQLHDLLSSFYATLDQGSRNEILRGEN